MNEYCVYCHTNKINGKKYIGMTKNQLKVRSQCGYGYRQCISFWQEIQKYGWGAFDHEILISNLSKKEAMQEEIKAIKQYRTTEQEYGYNISPGGSTLTENAKRILSECHQGSKNHRYGKPCPDAVLKSVRKEVVCMETGKYYESITEAHKQTGINLGHIASVCRNERKTAGGYHWTFA